MKAVEKRVSGTITEKLGASNKGRGRLETGVVGLVEPFLISCEESEDQCTTK